ncbi:hypothetical protein [Enterococcus sp. BWR-S5]|uniref:hypothetical protein n=1 Tax=Enterococcus sp. BWR-S5 TaxID=2787714 RepID=UPI001924B4C7|nr:hypothetical protein [Enterococcus sp. BWR-S5]MBL1225724.1 hypothetical protein [Enterococcus sp. BWR-S5]
MLKGKKWILEVLKQSWSTVLELIGLILGGIGLFRTGLNILNVLFLLIVLISIVVVFFKIYEIGKSINLNAYPTKEKSMISCIVG